MPDHSDETLDLFASQPQRPRTSMDPEAGVLPPGHPYGEVPRVDGSDTSEAAAESMDESAVTLRQTVYLCILTSKDGMTDEELERVLDLRHQTASARRRELVLMGRVKDTGRRRTTTSGRTATVWEAT